MKKKIVVFAGLIFHVVFTNFYMLVSQNLSIKGIVYDESEKKVLVGANIAVVQGAKIINGTLSNLFGRFEITNLQDGNYSLRISYVGYKSKNIPVELKGRNVDLKNIFLKQDTINLQGVMVTALIKPMEMKDDTTEYNAAAFKIQKFAGTDELIRKMPGVEITDGKILAHGKEVQQILLNGKDAPPGSPQQSLKNIPAEIVSKVQVYDKKSDVAEKTGIDDGTRTTTMNIQTKEKYKKSKSGKIIGGIGERGKSAASMNLNIMNNNDRFFINGVLANIEDLAIIEYPTILLFSTDVSGAKYVKKNLGMTFAREIYKDFNLSIIYTFDRSEREKANSINREYYLDNSMSQYYSENSNNNSTDYSHKFDLSTNYKYDSLNYFLFAATGNYSSNLADNIFLGRNYNDERNLNTINSKNKSDQDFKYLNSYFAYSRRLSNSGRTMAITIMNNISLRDDGKSGLNENYFFNDIDSSGISNNRQNKQHKITNVSAGVMYSEPLSSKSSIMFLIDFEREKQTNDFNLKSNLFNSKLLSYDSLQADIIQRSIKYNKLTLKYFAKNDEMSLSSFLLFNYSEIQNTVKYLPFINSTKYRFSISPMVRFTYSPAKNKTLTFNYYLYQYEPDIDQIKPLIDNSNPLQLYIGNPDLDPVYNHRFQSSFTIINTDNASSIKFSLNGQLTEKYIANKSIIAVKDTIVQNNILLPAGSRLTQPVNIDGYRNLYCNVTYSHPLELIKSTYTTSLSYKLSRIPAMQKNIKLYSVFNTYSFRISINSKISSDLNFDISSNNSYNVGKFSYSAAANQKYYNNRSNFNFYCNIWSGIILRTDLEYSYEGRIAGNQNNCIWDASLSKKLLPDDAAEIRVTINDIINKTKSINRIFSDMYYEEVRSQVVGRYFFVSFSYKFLTN